MTTKVNILLFLCWMTVFLTGCPRLAYIDVYNNSLVKIKVNASGYEQSIDPGESARFKFTGENLIVESELGRWDYSRNIPHSGRDGEYFDGTLRVQINQDGRAYVLKIQETPPIKKFIEQPQGYPLVEAS